MNNLSQMMKMMKKELNFFKIENSSFKREKDQRNREVSVQNTHQFIELTFQPIYFKLKMSDLKSFTGKREEYKSQKWDMYNKFIWELERFNIDGY